MLKSALHHVLFRPGVFRQFKVVLFEPVLQHFEVMFKEFQKISNFLEVLWLIFEAQI